MDESYHSLLAAGVEKKYRALEMSVMEDIIRRVRKAGSITDAADWQIQRLLILGNSTQDIEDLIRKAVDGSEEEVRRLYEEVIDREYTRDKAVYEKIGKDFLPYEQNPELQQITAALVTQSNDDLYNITRSTGFMLDMGNGQKVFTPLADVYNGYLDDAITGMANGAYDYNTLVRRLVGQMTASGLRTDHAFKDGGSDYGIDYASGHHNRIDVAARRALLTGFGQLASQVTDMNAQRLGTQYFEVTWHGGARPDHALWQGKVYTREQLRTICGLDTGPGLCGWNCRHTYYPFIPGISERQYTDEWLAEQNTRENMPKTFKGKEYTTYEATQKQRQMETAMRARREQVQLLRQAGADPEDITLAQCKYQAQLDEYKSFSRKMGLPEQMERVYSGRTKGRIAPSPQTYAKYRAEQANKKAARAQAMQKKLAKQSTPAIMKSTADAKDFTQLKDYVKQKYGMKWDNTVDALDFISVREGLLGIERIMQEFPKARSSFQGIGTDKRGIMCATYHGEINFNPVYYASRQAALDAHKPTSFHPAGSSPFGSGAHEAGHLLEKALIDQTNNGQTFPLGALSWRDCTYAKAVVSDACKAAKKLPECKGMTNRDLKLKISGYAASGGPSECLAEAVSDYAMNGNNAAPLSREIWKILKKELG